MPTLTEAVNGHVKGRAVPPETLYLFTFQGTGRTVQIRKLSALIRDEARRQARRELPEPQPPLNEVDYGAGKIMEANPSHPLYQKLHKDWERAVGEKASEKLQTIAILRGVVCDVDTAAVKAARADLDAAGISTAAYDDHYVYVAFVCIGPYEDWSDLLSAVFQRAGPSEAAIEAHTESFRGNGEQPAAQPPEPRSTE